MNPERRELDLLNQLRHYEDRIIALERELTEAQATIARLRGGICEAHIEDNTGVCPYCEAVRQVDEMKEKFLIFEKYFEKNFKPVS